MDTKKLRQKILDLAIRGKLVPQNPNDEPASVLLDRIRAEKERLIAEGKIKRPKKSKSTSAESQYQNFEPPFEIPNSWEWVRLEEIIHLQSGKNLSVSNLTNDGEYPVFGGNGISGYYNLYNVEDNTIIIGRVGFYCGSVHLTSSNSWVTDNALIVSLNCCDNLINKDWLFRVLQWVDIKRTSNSTAQPVVSGKGIYPLYIPLPPFSEQINIASLLLSTEKLITLFDSNQTRLIDSIKIIKSKILDLAMQGKLVPQDPADESAAEMLHRVNPKAEIITDNPHFRNNWVECKLSDLCTFLSRGKSPKYSDAPNMYPVFAQKCNLKEGGISLEQARFLDEDTVSKWQEKYKLKTGDVLINSTGTGTVGRTRLFHEDYLGTYPFVVPDSHVSVVRTHKEINSSFIFYYLDSNKIHEYFEDNLAGSTNQKELYIDVIGETIVNLPPINEQARIVAKMEELYSILDEIEASLQA